MSNEVTMVRCDHADSDKCPLDTCPHRAVHECTAACAAAVCWNLNGSDVFDVACTEVADGTPATCSECERLQNALDTERGHREADNAESRAQIERLRAVLLDIKDQADLAFDANNPNLHMSASWVSKTISDALSTKPTK